MPPQLEIGGLREDTAVGWHTNNLKDATGRLGEFRDFGGVAAPCADKNPENKLRSRRETFHLQKFGLTRVEIGAHGAAAPPNARFCSQIMVAPETPAYCNLGRTIIGR